MCFNLLVLCIFLFNEVFHGLILVNILETADALKLDDGVSPLTDYDWLNNVVPSNYDQTVSAGRFMNDKKAGITMNILPISISDISEKNMYFEVELQFRIFWKEPRLPFGVIQNRTSLIYVSPPREFLSRLWSPYLRFTNCKYCEVQRRIGHSGNKHVDVWIRVLDETIVLHHRQSFKFFCHFDLRKYPLDSHECNIFIDLLVLPNENGYLFLKHAPLNNLSESHYVQKYIPAQYKLIDVVTVNECSDLNPFAINKPNNECIRMSFHFQRLIYNEIMLLYLPSIFIVVVSWLSFWMDVGASAPRVALGLTSLLTLSTQFANAQKNLPPVSYVKAMDVWMLNCSFIVFMSLVEYFLSYQLKNWRMKTSIKNSNFTKVYPILKEDRATGRKMKRIVKESENATTKVDFVARIIFPTSFMIFNIVYWIYYMNIDIQTTTIM